MNFDAKEILLKDGRKCVLRSPQKEDAEALLEHLRITSGETEFMGRFEDEITMSIEEEEAYLAKQLADPKAVLICAFVDGKIAASAGVNRYAPYRKYAHRGGFGISIKKAYWHLGIGTAMMEEIISAAVRAGYSQLELEVVTENHRALELYKRFGFEIYGTRPNAFSYKDGTFGRDHLMALWLGK